MAEPFKRSEPVQGFINKLAGKDQQQSIREDKCVLCNAPATTFNDALSRQEFTISGLCQKCQDIAFTDEPDEEGA